MKNRHPPPKKKKKEEGSSLLASRHRATLVSLLYRGPLSERSRRSLRGSGELWQPPTPLVTSPRNYPPRKSQWAHETFGQRNKLKLRLLFESRGSCRLTSIWLFDPWEKIENMSSSDQVLVKPTREQNNKSFRQMEVSYMFLEHQGNRTSPAP